MSLPQSIKKKAFMNCSILAIISIAFFYSYSTESYKEKSFLIDKNSICYNFFIPNIWKLLIKLMIR